MSQKHNGRRTQKTVSIVNVGQAKVHFQTHKQIVAHKAERFDHRIGDADERCFYIYLPSQQDVITHIVRSNGEIYDAQTFWYQYPVI